MCEVSGTGKITASVKLWKHKRDQVPACCALFPSPVMAGDDEAEQGNWTGITETLPHHVKVNKVFCFPQVFKSILTFIILFLVFK